jgi:hypothetical protein
MNSVIPLDAFQGFDAFFSTGFYRVSLSVHDNPYPAMSIEVGYCLPFLLFQNQSQIRPVADENSSFVLQRVFANAALFS